MGKGVRKLAERSLKEWVFLTNIAGKLLNLF